MSLISKLRDRINNRLESSNQQSIIIIIVVFLVVLMLFFYNKISLQQNNCSKITSYYDNENKNGTSYIKYDELISDASYNSYTDSTGTNKSLKLKNMYIKTAYNACCSGNFKMDYVDLCALKMPSIYGVRALDFQIYSLKNEPIVAASTTSSHNYKETINHLNLVDVMYEVKKLFLSPNTETGMQKDPLFLIFRMHTKNEKVYDRMASILGEVYNYTSLKRKQVTEPYDSYYNSFKDIEFDLLGGSVIIILIHAENSNSIIESTKLGSYVDIYGSDMQVYRYNDLKDTQSQSVVTRMSNIKMSYCMPTLEKSNTNFDYLLPFSMGFQFVGMNFQNPDVYLDEYNNFFKNSYSISQNVTSGSGSENTSHLSFAKKPDVLINYA